MIERTTLQTGLYKPIRSFVERAGRIAPTHKNLVTNLWPKYGLALTHEQLKLAQVFGREAPLILEIGFGDGRSLLELAKSHPQKNFIGIEVYKAGIAKLLIGLHENKISNVRIFCADALEVLHCCIPDASVEQVQLFFPDPWPKLRHHKRRIVQPEFVQLIGQKLQNGGTLHMATDWEDYALHMLHVLQHAPNWQNLGGANKFIPRPSTRALTKFEQRGHRHGLGVWDLMFRKNT